MKEAVFTYPDFADYDHDIGGYKLHPGAYRVGSGKQIVTLEKGLTIAVDNINDLQKSVEIWNDWKHFWRPHINKFIQFNIGLMGIALALEALTGTLPFWTIVVGGYTAYKAWDKL